ncbi:hypothetical protein [Nocardiopsis salina]|nr:hypothetical protein [Nocardiopsis salina]
MDDDPLTRDDQAQLAEILTATGAEGAYAIAEYLGIDLDADETDES